MEMVKVEDPLVFKNIIPQLYAMLYNLYCITPYVVYAPLYIYRALGVQIGDP